MTTETPERAIALTAGDALRGLQTVRNVLAPDLSDDELRLFAMVATRSGLDPFAKQIYAIKRRGRVTFQTSIDGYRSIAARTGMYDGQDDTEYGPWVEKPYGHPEFATVRVHRKGVAHPISATAYWDEYVADPGQSGNGDVMWKKMPRVMIAKVAEALALRKAFPYDPERREGIGADVYTADEMAQADRQAPASGQAAQPQTPAARVAQRRAAVQKPATPTDAPGAADQGDAVWTSAPAEDVAAAPADVVEGDAREVVDVVGKLRELAESSDAKGPMTADQRARFPDLISQVGGANEFRPVVIAAFGSDAYAGPSAAVAGAIVSIADSFEDPAAFKAAWTAAVAAITTGEEN